MSLSDVVRNIKEKAKDLPMHALQSALSGVGHALLLGDRMRTKIKKLGGEKEEERAGGGDQAEAKRADQADKAAKGAKGGERERAGEAAGVAQAEEARPARREPVIFAPRTVPPEAAPNGDGQRTETAGPAKPATEAAGTGTVASSTETTVPTPRPAPAEPPVETPAEPPKTPLEAATRPAEPLDVAPEPSVEAPAAPAEPTSPEVKEKVEEAVAKAAEATEAATEAAAAATPDTEPEAAPEVAPEVAEPKKAEKAERTKEADAERAGAEQAGALKEPLPGYADLTIASLRARMRGRSADQMRELLAYEKATANRPTVVRMYENRLAKLGD